MMIFIDNEADVRRHLGQCRAEAKTSYERAWDMIEAANSRSANTPDIRIDWRCKVWARDNHKARLTAQAAVENSTAVKAARKLADKARSSGSLRDYAKAVAARIVTEESVWEVAYGRAMPKTWRLKS